MSINDDSTDSLAGVASPGFSARRRGPPARHWHSGAGEKPHTGCASCDTEGVYRSALVRAHEAAPQSPVWTMAGGNRCPHFLRVIRPHLKIARPERF